MLHLNFLSKVSKSPVYVSKKTGLIYHSDISSSEKTVEKWSDKIFNPKKNNPKKEIYTSDFPGMQARHYFVIDFLRRKVKLKNKSICDFGCGEGSILFKLRKFFGLSKLVGTEHSQKNINIIKKIFKKNKFNSPKLFQCSIEDFAEKKINTSKVDVGILTWTLCNCSEPLRVVKSLSESIKKDGYLIVAESSRIFVPFKKPIQNNFNLGNLMGSYHPWHWSFNSLTNIFKLYGFELISNNRYWDEDNLVLIFKNSKIKNPKFIFDNYLHVASFYKRWLKDSLKYYNNDIYLK